MNRVYLLMVVSLFCNMGFAQSESEGIAYLFEPQGTVFLIRKGQTQPVHTACMTLLDGDSLTLQAGASARIVFPSAVYELVGPGCYSAVNPERVLKKEEAGEDHALDAAWRSRGTDNPFAFMEDMDIVLSPAELFAYVKPPVFRCLGDNVIGVLSPRGQMRSTAPQLRWKGAEDTVYEISVLLIEGGSESRLPWVKVQGNSARWDQTGWPLLNPGDFGKLCIRQNGKMEEGEGVYFLLLSQNEAQNAGDLIQSLRNSVPSGSARRFMEASVLMMREWNCAAEARLLAEDLVAQEPENPVYLKLLQRASSRLGLSEEVLAIETLLNKAAKDWK